jgi:hypothetical protein
VPSRKYKVSPAESCVNAYVIVSQGEEIDPGLLLSPPEADGAT